MWQPLIIVLMGLENMIRNIIGVILIFISCAILVINKVYLEPYGLRVIPYWVFVVCACLSGYIPDYKTKKRNNN
ncbi:hypothetical protein BVG01_29155 [Bacillus anthracis]|nr:hypothetical protein BVG01_29155 [Bacillus anthracis]